MILTVKVCFNCHIDGEICEMVSAETVDVVVMAEMVDIRAQGALASLVVHDNVHHDSRCTLASVVDSAGVVVVVVESVDKIHLMDALSNEQYAFVASHNPLDKPFVAPKRTKRMR